VPQRVNSGQFEEEDESPFVGLLKVAAV
jgi:hypothetical protein